MGGGYPKSPSLFGKFGKPIPNGINQQGLGDCWFLASAAAVAEEAHRIERIIENKEYSKAGIFRFKFWVKDKWYGVNVDDRLPCKKRYNGWRPFATQRSKAGAWWMPLLEKAYAKLDQNYDRIIGGLGAEGLRTLTGMPTVMIRQDKSKAGTLYPILKFFAHNNYPSTAGCCRNGGKYDLVSGHAYSFLDVQELKKGGKVVHKIVKVRNPWNHERYNGPWRDSDPEWNKNPQWKKQVNLVEADDGIFWMNWDTFITYYDTTSTALYRDYKHKVVNYKPTKRETVYRIDNPKAQYFYVSVDTYSGRNFPRASKCKPKHNAYIELRDANNKALSSDGSRYSFISGQTGWGLRGLLHEKLPAGKYKLVIINQAAPNAPDFGINFYASE